MSLDDKATVAALDFGRAVFREHIAAHGGRVVDMSGDSVLSVFQTATGAVAAALAVQQRLTASSAEVPEERRMRFRIGIHVGDVIERDDGTVYGDGVNIASRLEGLAVPGDVACSQAVHDMVVRRVDAVFADIGEQTVKNIAQPVRAYRIRPPDKGQTISPERMVRGRTLPIRAVWASAKRVAKLSTLKSVLVAIAITFGVLGGIALYRNIDRPANPSSVLSLIGSGNAGPLSIVVLPFDNLTGDQQQAYVADGLTAAVTADLSRIRDAFVVGAATAYAYKEKRVSAQQIGKELGVRFLLQGSVQRNDDTLRINAQLADTTTNEQLWSEIFDGSRTDLFALQDLVTTRIGNSIGREMVIKAATEGATRKSTPNAVDLLLRARALDLKPVSLAVYEEKQTLYRQVLLLDPGNVQAMAGLAAALAGSAFNGLIDDTSAAEKLLVEGRDLALRAKERDPGIASIYATLNMYAATHGDYEGAIRSDEIALSLEPKNPRRILSPAGDYADAGDPLKAVDLYAQSIRLDPRHPHEFALSGMGVAQFMLGDDNAAIAWLLKAVDANANRTQYHAYLAMAYARKGDPARARLAVAAVLRLDPKFGLSKFDLPLPGYPPGYREFWNTKLLPAARLAGLPE